MAKTKAAQRKQTTDLFINTLSQEIGSLELETKALGERLEKLSLFLDRLKKQGSKQPEDPGCSCGGVCCKRDTES
jgi:hypothetical protein